MRVLILGASGRTGTHVLNESLLKGYEVNCLVRNKDSIKVKSNHLHLFVGSPANKASLEEALKNCHAIISVLNISRNSDFPWSHLRTPSTFLSQVMQNIIELSNQRSLIRIIVCSAWGVGKTFVDIPFWFRLLIKNSKIGTAYADHERQEEHLMKSKLAWTLVRPTGLTNSKKEEIVLESYNNYPKPKLLISRVSVAKYLVNALERPDLIQKLPVLSAA